MNIKTLWLIDDSGVPTGVYYSFLDQSRSKQILTDQIKIAYSDLFQLNNKAQNITQEEVKNKFRTLTQWSKSDKVLWLMAKTFRVLCDYADWKNKEISKAEKKKVHLREQVMKEIIHQSLKSITC